MEIYLNGLINLLIIAAGIISLLASGVVAIIAGLIAIVLGLVNFWNSLDCDIFGFDWFVHGMSAFSILLLFIKSAASSIAVFAMGIIGVAAPFIAPIICSFKKISSTRFKKEAVHYV